MGEFSDDDNDDFNNFDLASAVASAKQQQPYQPPPSQQQTGATPSFRNTNITHEPSNNMEVDTGSATKRSSTNPYDNTTPGSNKKLKSTESTANTPKQSSSPTSNLDNDNEEPISIPLTFKTSMTSTLTNHFGLSTFRSGQLNVLYSLLDGGGKDTCVFWATGAGKSLCYQLPPLHLNQVAIVISPLISLMEDQVSKLNGRSGNKEIATFLGSSQSNPQAEQKALNGDYSLIYVTPEKLTSSTAFLDSLAYMHMNKKKICLIAVDESHCVSQWGHDFRPSFLKIGPSIRNHSILQSIPLLALTATAVPRVQSDIVTNLQMNTPTIAKKSFDRPNLKIVIKRKPRNGALGAFDDLTSDMAKSIVKQGGTTGGRVNISGKSTIVYCATKKEVETITAKIIQDLAHQIVQQNGQDGSPNKRHSLTGNNNDKKTAITIQRATELASKYIKSYHAGLSFGHRTDAHTDFLIGKVTVVVATVAFGMGIDKPDIRRVVHWGAPKTVEEYYQQMGRAGRDGLPAECIMYADMHDFAKYNDDFYLGALSGEAKASTIKSMNALKDFAMNDTGCRRASLLEFFDETPSFGKRCGTCDLCLNHKSHGDDYERDFQNEGARVILFAAMACPHQAWATMEKIINGNTVETYRYHRSLKNDPSRVVRKIEATKEKMKKKRSISYFKDLLPSLVNGGYLKQESVKSSGHKYARSYMVHDLTPKGKGVLSDGAIMLPVPTSIREQEKIEEAKKKQALADLKDKGVDLGQVPQEELESGEGEALTALKRWYSYVDSMEARGRADVVNQLDDLKTRIEAWRLDMAERYRMAPASVMEEHLLVKIAYMTASLRAGSRCSKEALEGAGVRSNGIDELTKVLGEWSDENTKESAATTGSNGSGAQDAPMNLTPGRVFQPTNSWRYAVYKPQKKTGKATWEVSYDRFVNGEHPQTIAMTQTSGKPIQVATVVGHLLQALEQGRAVDIHQLATSDTPPTKNEWEELERCSVETGLDVKGDPATSGADSGRFTMKDFLVPIMGNSFCLKEYTERTPEESASFSKWCGLLKWYMTLKRVNYTPISFSKVEEEGDDSDDDDDDDEPILASHERKKDNQTLSSLKRK